MSRQSVDNKRRASGQLLALGERAGADWLCIRSGSRHKVLRCLGWSVR